MSKALAHGVTGSVLSLAQGGSWETGFLAGFGAGMVSGVMGGANIALKTIAAALVGGTASAMGGGKFANGAVTGAVALLIGEGIKSLQKWHYSRNQELLGEYERLGLKEGRRYSNEELRKMGLREITDNWQKRYHLHGEGNSANRKWVSTEGTFGRIEVVTDGSGYLNISPNVMGTLNRGSGFMSHFIKDMVPYYMFGNSALDTASLFTRFTGMASGGGASASNAIQIGAY